MSADGYRIEAGTIHCDCGRMYHVSLFHTIIRAIAARAYRFGRMTERDAIDEAVESGYRVRESTDDREPSHA